MSEVKCDGCGGVFNVDGLEPFTVIECSECESEVVVPYEFGHFSLTDYIGRQSFFEVYEGYDTTQNLKSVVFFLDNASDGYEDLLALAKSKAKQLVELRHTNVSPIMNVGETEGNFFVTEPKMDGYDMGRFDPEAQKELKLENVLEIMKRVCVGLSFTHNNNVAHHNLTLESVHIDARNKVRIKNFFISRVCYDWEHKNHLPSSVSPYFISPEKAEHGEEDRKGDLFSCGVMFYYLLTGVYPFEGDTDEAIINSRIKRAMDDTEVFIETKKSDSHYVPPKSPSKMREDIPRALGHVILRMLDPNPMKRPTLSQVLDAISISQAEKDKKQSIEKAQKEMVLTDTISIPRGVFKKKERKKGFLNFLNK